MVMPASFEYRIQIPHDPRSVSVARTSLRAALTAHRIPDLVDRAELLASEMLTNAIVHAGGEAQLRFRWARDALLMSVWDTSPKPPGMLIAGSDDEGGRGLHLLRTLADRWDHHPVPPDRYGAMAKVVWCEIGRTQPVAV